MGEKIKTRSEKNKKKTGKTLDRLNKSVKASAEKAKKKIKKKAKEIYKKAKEAKKKLRKFYNKTLEKVKDPKLRKKLKGILKDLYEDYKERREKEKERERDEKEIKKSKKIEDYKFKGSIDAKKGEVFRACQIICVNTHAIAYNLERTNKETGGKYEYTNNLGKQLKALNKLKKPGEPKIVPNILRGSMSLFKNGIGNFASFKERIKILDKGGDLNNAAEILSRCAIGKYQIIPIHHFDRVTRWKKQKNDKRSYEQIIEDRLELIYLFLRYESLQGNVAKKIIESKYRDPKYNKDPYIMAASYYAGGKGRRIMKKYRNAVKRGEITDTSSLEKKQAYGYGSIMEYSEKVVKYQKVYQGIYPDKSFTETFQMAIAKKESGYLRNKRIKA